MTNDKEPHAAANDDLIDTSEYVTVPGEMSLDATSYIEEIRDAGFCDEQAREVFELLVSMMKTCVEMGFKVDVCGQVFRGDHLGRMRRKE